MMYSFEKTYNPWDTEPDVFDTLLEEELELANAKNGDDVSLEDLADDEEMELDEDFDL